MIDHRGANAAHVLIVDDEEDILEILSARLASVGHRVSKAQLAVEAMDIITRDVPDIIVLDVMMPFLNGMQLCWLLKDDEVFREIPIVMLTAKSQQIDKFWAKEAGVAAYLTKPFNPGDVAETVREVLEKNRTKDLRQNK